MGWERQGWTPEGYPPTWHYAAMSVALLVAILNSVEARMIILPEDAAVLALCERHGFGAVMDSAARQWKERDPQGAITTGPAVGSTVWGRAYRKWLAKGCDHGDAAYRADQAEIRAIRRRVK